MSDEARAAFRAALAGPVGTEASFEMNMHGSGSASPSCTSPTPPSTWPDSTRSAMELRVVRHDAAGRPEVRAETRYTIDRATGVVLRSQSVTPMADGEVTTTTSWQIGRSTS